MLSFSNFLCRDNLRNLWANSSDSKAILPFKGDFILDLDYMPIDSLGYSCIKKYKGITYCMPIMNL